MPEALWLQRVRDKIELIIPSFPHKMSSEIIKTMILGNINKAIDILSNK